VRDSGSNAGQPVNFDEDEMGMPLMPKATAVWLVENTTLTFKQIADFCNLHEVEVQGIADGEVAKRIVGYNPINSGQLTREEIELSSKDQNRTLKINTYNVQGYETINLTHTNVFRNVCNEQRVKNYQYSKT